uniref:Peptidase_S9_N domain-containing protein n=1 Tax=Caenorhabditis tropicalis TaxID=1561998 RepID=A0A1I7TZU0_9PELO
MSDQDVVKKKKVNKPKYAPHMTKEYMRNQQLSDFFRQTNVPNSMCMLCGSNFPEGTHIHCNLMYLTPMTRDENNKNSYNMGAEMFQGDRVILKADTRRSKEEHSHLLLITPYKTVKIELYRKSPNCLEFVRLLGSGDEFWNSSKPDNYWELAYSLNGNAPVILRMPHDKTHTRLLDTPSNSVLTMVYWKKTAPYPEYSIF